MPFEDFEKYPLPNDIEEYKLYKYNLTNFILNRNQRIKNLVNEKNFGHIRKS